MIKPPSEFRTDRLLLRTPQLKDADSILREYASDIDAARYMTWVPHESVDTVVQYLGELLERDSGGVEYGWAISELEDAGSFGVITVEVKEHIANFGYVLGKRKWRQGYMTESLSVVSDWMLSQPGIFRASAWCDVDNIGSARVLEKCGFVCEGISRRWSVHPNLSDEPRDCYVYARVR